MDELLGRARHNRTSFEREWYQNIRFYSGHHWDIWDRARGQWRMKRGPKWFPRPVTNRVAEHVDDNISALTRTPPELSWLPTDEDPGSIAAADVADRINDTIAEETGRLRQARLKAAWAVITGDCFVEGGYDPSWEHGTVPIYYGECKDCGFVGDPRAFKEAKDACPECGSEEIGEAFERTGLTCERCVQEFPMEESMAFQPCPSCTEEITMAASTTGLPPPEAPKLKPLYGDTKIGDIKPKGRMFERVRSPFEVFYELRTVRKFTKEGGLRWCIIVELIDIDEARQQHPGIKLNESGSAGETGGKGHSLSMQYLEAISMLTGILDPDSLQHSPGAGGGESHQVLRECLYHLPTDEFPEGLVAVRYGLVVAEVKPLPAHESDGTPFIPVVHIPFKEQPGRVPGRTFLSDIVPLNRIRNENESQQILTERRMANPVNLVPDGSMDRMPTGEPGETWVYRHLSAGSGRPPIPNRLPGMDPGVYFDRRQEALDTQMERLAGSFGIAHGEAPKGIRAASALALLGERQERAISPQIQAWEQAHEAIAKMMMNIFREYANEPRLRPIRDAQSKWAFEKWSNADLGGNITVRVESGSATPKSAAQMRATVEALLRLPGFLDTTKPEVRRRILQIMGMAQLEEYLDLDMRDAQQENDLFLRLASGEEGGEPLRFRALIDNHVVHLAEHVKMAKQDKWLEIEKKAQAGEVNAAGLVQMFYAHLNDHAMALAPPPGAEGEGEPGRGPGRPEGRGPVFNAGRQDVPPAERAIVEPGTGEGGQGIG